MNEDIWPDARDTWGVDRLAWEDDDSEVDAAPDDRAQERAAPDDQRY
jgi:hypothetical protein